MLTSDFDFQLPEELIAQEPLPERAQSRMLVLRRDDGGVVHRSVRDIVEYLREGDVLVTNDTRVMAARLFGVKADTGGRVEVLLLEPEVAAAGVWRAMYKGHGRARDGLRLILADGAVVAEVVGRVAGEGLLLKLSHEGTLAEVLDRHGVPPVPPYIVRRGAADARVVVDRNRYQTVYARELGAIAAPTAGLHFSLELLERVRGRGVGVVSVTLHVGPGTFRPVKCDVVEEHRMESERYTVSESAAEAIEGARARGGRVFAVGSTVVRTLESVALKHGRVVSGSGRTELFIKPGYSFRVVDGLLTNFHLPRSTLLMMVAAFAGREPVMAAYRAAVSEGYRFYSYGDCMLVVSAGPVSGGCCIS